MRAKGFTLVELLVTIGVLVVLASFLVPTYQIVLSQFQLSSAAEKLADFIRYTEQKTVTEQLIYGVTFTQGATTVPQFLYNPSNGTRTQQAVHALPNNIAIGTVNFSGQSHIQFSASGAPNYSGSLVLTDNVRNRNRLIEIRPSGAIFANQGEY